MRKADSQLYALPVRPSACPCSRGSTGIWTAEAANLSTLIRSRSAAAIAHWPYVPNLPRHSTAKPHTAKSGQRRHLLGAPPEGLAAQVVWIRKFRAVRMDDAAAFPSCRERRETLSGPCEIAARHLLQPPPATSALPSARHRRELNLTRSRSAFWMAFSWSTQYAHFTLEHLPRMWYYQQLRRHLGSREPPPVLVVPPRLAAWQSALLRGLSSSAAIGAVPAPAHASAPLLTLQPPHWFSSLYVPGMLSHIGMLWTPQAVAIWERVRLSAGGSRHVPLLLPAQSAHSAAPREAASAAPAADGARLLYSLRAPGGRSAGGARVLSDQPVLVRGLQAMGFTQARLEGLPLAHKVAALAHASVLVVECGSALANAMLFPRGMALVVLCMREHTASEGCYGQLLASRFTAAPVYTLRIGEPLDAPDDYAAQATRKNVRFNVRPHARWTLRVPQTLRAIAHLARLPSGKPARGGAGAGSGGSRRRDDAIGSWPPPPGCALGGTRGGDGATASAPVLASPRTEDTATAGEAHDAAGRGGGTADHEWWHSPEELYRPPEGSSLLLAPLAARGGKRRRAPSGEDQRAASTSASTSGGVWRSRIFSLVPCAGSPWAAPRCWELRRELRRGDAVPSGGPVPPRLEWRPCTRDAQCSRWRWCTRLRSNSTAEGGGGGAATYGAATATSGVQDRYVNCEQRV